MFVRKNIGPVVVGRETIRFKIGEKVSEEALRYFKDTKQLEALTAAGAIGEKQDEPVQPSESGQPVDTDPSGRADVADDDKKPNRRGGKHKGEDS
jgi:hypothetical protein